MYFSIMSWIAVSCTRDVLNLNKWRSQAKLMMICDITDSRCNSLFTFLSSAREKVENQNRFQRGGKSYLQNLSRFEA